MLNPSKLARVQFAIFSICANSVVAGVVYHVYHTAGYRSVAGMLPLLLWSLASNVSSSILIAVFARQSDWKLSPVVIYAEVLAGLLPLFLVRCLRVPVERRMMLFGLLWSLFALLKGLVLTW